MRYNMLVFSMLFAVGLLLANGISYSYDRAIEAEMADTIEAPMVIAEDGEASGGKFIWMPGEPATGGGGEGWAEFVIDIPAAGTYALWGKVIAWDGNSDSFWVTWQPADPDENPQDTNNNHFRWAVAGGEAWHWDRINHWLDNNDRLDREWDFNKAGETVLRIGVREDAAMLDVIFITDNLSADEAEVSLRDPGPEDATPVEPREKLTTTWGKLKAQR
ncbi:hypothetical protein C6501_07480 [Candidatus Poribacteria bacterium]|nr:MAG: hypothetical protein C6501_07480 [Candidatus Poribacteria bacterium]